MKEPTPQEKKIPLDEVQQSLYAKHQKVYPRQVRGLFAKLKVTSVLALLGLYYLVPWIQWGSRQAVLFDLPERKFYLFGLVFWPQDFIYLTSLLIIAALSLFFFTALAGRLWCGFACPQTVWTDVFLWMERWAEGDRSARMKLDKSPMSLNKFRRKATKQAMWISFSLLTGFTFVGYFTPIRELTMNLLSFSLGPWETFWFLFYGFATYGNAGYLREQICIYMCPYARFQSAMFDRDTLIIAYDTKRGEPRGQRKRNEEPKSKGLGDCVNCTLCVQVCPTGIDIRDGLQYQCISCSACIDVCDEVMDKMGYSKGLIRYTTENALEGKATHILRPRMMVYAAILLAIFAALVYSIAVRTPLGLDVIRDRNILFRETNEGLIENVYILKVINMDDQAHSFEITASGIEGLAVAIDEPEIFAETGRVVEVPVRLQAPPANMPEMSNKVAFELRAKDQPDLHVIRSARFLGPLKLE
jgi:cytochrome c oxidase accessory protein FixG